MSDDDVSDLAQNFKPNKAVEKLISMPPALLEAIVNDPKEMAKLARAWTAHGMHQVAANLHLYSPAQKMQFLELASRIGDLHPQKQAVLANQGAGFAVNIVLSQAPDSIRVEKTVEAA